MAPRIKTMSEDTLQTHVVKLLNAYARPDIAWWSTPNGDLRSRRVGARLKATGLRKGASDLNFLIDSKFHAVELKTEVGKLSTEQLQFGEDVERAGGFFHTAFGLDEAIGVLKGLNAFRPNVNISPVKPSRAAAPVSPNISLRQQGAN